MPCNGTKDKEVMRKLNTQTWDELWNHPDAMYKYIWKPANWIIIYKFKDIFTKLPCSMYANKMVSDNHDGIVTKEDFDKCSTCDACGVVNNGHSAACQEQLKNKTGEEIVDADIAMQMKE